MIQKTKPFKAVSMPCTEKQFNEKLKPILEFLGVSIRYFWGFENNTEYAVTNYAGLPCSVGKIYSATKLDHNRHFHPEFCPKTFIEALGYDFIYVMEVMDRERNLKLHWGIPTHYKGKIKDFPKEIVEKMLERQFEQTGKKDVSVFEAICTEGKFNGGFDWHETIEGEGFWEEVLADKNFDLFFEKYPKDSEPRTTHYKIIRPILFFAKEDVVHRKTLRKYFTKKAIKSLIKHKYIINQ